MFKVASRPDVESFPVYILGWYCKFFVLFFQMRSMSSLGIIMLRSLATYFQIVYLVALLTLLTLGEISLLTRENEFFVDPIEITQHHSYVTSLDVTSDGSRCISGAADNW